VETAVPKTSQKWNYVLEQKHCAKGKQ